MRVTRWGALFVLVGLVAPAGGCREEPTSNFDGNRSPETYVSYAPAESTLAFYRIHLFWNGSDPDGSVDHYEFAVTDSNKVPGEDTPGFDGYFRTDKTDSVFVLKADSPQILGHRFYVRAVDNEGKKDPTPAWSYFVALDVNFPSIYFVRGIGTWTQRDGSTGTLLLESSQKAPATDTIGVGGNISVAWCGYDLDRGLFNPTSPCRPQDLVGYEYRASNDQAYLGSLADTAYFQDFGQPPGTPLNRWFSGTEVLRVRAIDEAGAKTNPDSVRSVVVNFNPICWIIDASQDAADTLARRPSFISRDVVYPSGTVLALDGPSRNISFYYTGLDDRRDMSLNPAEPNGITGFRFRKLILPGGGPAYKEIQGWFQYPHRNVFAHGDANNLPSGDYLFLIAARDELGRWGAPDSLRVGVNYRPYVLSVDAVVEGDTTLVPLWPGPSSTITLQKDGFGFYPDLEIRILASDVHTHPDKDPLDPNPVVEDEIGQVPEYRAALNGEPAVSVLVPEGDPYVKFYAVSGTGEPGFLHAGLNRLEIQVKDIPGRAGDLNVEFIVVLEE